MSNKREREKRKEERIAAETRVETGDRRTRILQIAAGAVFLVIVAVVIVIVVNSASSGSGGDTKIEEAATVDRLLSGIPQSELHLGDKSAPVELIEFGDLQCPICKANSEEVMPDVIRNKIKTGEAKLIFRNFIVISEASIPAGAAAIAAGRQGRGFNFIETFYRNQGKEGTNYVDDAFLEAIAKAAGVQNLGKWNQERKSSEVVEEVNTTNTEASSKFGFTGTPSFVIRGPSTNGYEIVDNTVQSSSEFEEEIDRAS